VNGGVFYLRSCDRGERGKIGVGGFDVPVEQSGKELWILQGAKARVACGPLLAEIDVEQPGRGLHHLKLPAETLNGRLMGVEVSDEGATNGREQAWQPDDVYCRGSDLVATYREPSGQPFQLQVYWRVLPAAGFESCALEAIVSVQTRAWEAYPAVSLSSALDVSAAQQHAGGVRFLSHHDWSYVEAAPTDDFEPSIGETSSGLAEARWRYGKRFMERGVIRRLRLRGAFVPIASAEAAIERMQAGFAGEAPPLTA
jgi:hypothetical protein